jgi:hypothetical protein
MSRARGGRGRTGQLTPYKTETPSSRGADGISRPTKPRFLSRPPSQAGITQFERAPSLNGEDGFTTAQADLVAEHFASGLTVATPQYQANCAGCSNPICRTVLNPVAPYEKLRDTASRAVRAAGGAAEGLVPVWPSDAELSRIRALTAPNK